MIKATLISGVEDMNIATSSTINRDVKPDLLKMLRAEHSPIRELRFRIEMEIPTFVSVHFVRHSATGQNHYVQSMRDDRGGSGDENRHTIVKHQMVINAQHLIDMSRKRLCSKSHNLTVRIWKKILIACIKIMPELKEVCLVDCDYRGGVCYEFKSCGYNPHYSKCLTNTDS